VATDHTIHTINARILTINSADRDSTVMDISGLLEGQTKPADVLTAFETALEMLKGEYQPAQIRFHEATGLLIARGHPEQIGTIQRVVQQLNEKAARLHRRAEEADNAHADASKVTELAAQLDQSRRQMEDLARQGAEWKTKFDVMQAELERARNELQARERAIADLQRQVNELTMERNQKKP
jgi:chromosome segregation ATPase